jgi:argonaute-like protein implicated in RNA metabolism and viral defense
MIKYHSPLVEVVWHDAATTFGWEHEDEADTREELMITVGFLIAKGEHTVIIASSIDQDTGKMNNSRMKIPIGMIKTIKELTVSYKKQKVKEEVQQ